MKGAVGQLAPGLHTGGPQDVHPLGAGDGVLDERRLANAGVAKQDERAAAALPGIREQGSDRVTFDVAAVEHGSILERVPPSAPAGGRLTADATGPILGESADRDTPWHQGE